MKYKNIVEIQQELVSITKQMFKDDIEVLMHLDNYQQFEMVFEVVSFLFEDYRKNFDKLIKTKFQSQLLEKGYLCRTYYILFTDNQTDINRNKKENDVNNNK